MIGQGGWENNFLLALAGFFWQKIPNLLKKQDLH
jgi:hypothetical protein